MSGHPEDPEVTTATQAETAETWAPAASVVPVAAGPATLPDRYEDRGLLGVGGMGEVRRVWDRELKRTVAMKLLKPRIAARSRQVRRFVEEAQTSAQLQHPGVLPVYEMGVLPDGRHYFTMQEIRGRTLGEAIDELHEASTESGWRAGASGLGMRRLVEAMRSVCEAVGYAHRRGVVHRDLKPANVLIGEDGEVLVVDWGIAWVREAAQDQTAVVTDRGPRPQNADATSLVGTPAYMSPEQARGEGVGPRSDIYALGAMLYKLLSGQHPHQHITDVQVLMAHRMMGLPPKPLDQVCGRPVPEELAAAVQRALSKAPDQRQAHGAVLGAEIGRWLDGEARRSRARELVEQAGIRTAASREHLDQAGRLRRQAAEVLEHIAAWADEEQKLPAWTLEGQAEDHERRAELALLEAEQTLHAALTYAPDLLAARAALATHYRAQHAEAEARRDGRATLRAEGFLNTQVAAMAPGEERTDHLAYLKGTGRLTLLTHPEGAEVVLHRFESHRRRLVPRAHSVLGRTPLVEVDLAPGSWLCVLSHPDCEDVRYPVQIDRQGHWHGRAPGQTQADPIPLPARGSLGSGVYIPPGWFKAGGDPGAAGSFGAARLWVDGFVLARDPTTNREWLAWCNDVRQREGLEAALKCVPTDRSGVERDEGMPIYKVGPTGALELGPDPDGDIWELDWPVVMITLAQALGYLAWRRERDGLPWRLPSELEWEKAARGVDGRHFVWGDHFDPSWAQMSGSASTGLAAIGAHPVDTSVYGVRGMMGNVSDSCLEQADTPPPEQRVVPGPRQQGDRQSGRGGNWVRPASGCRGAHRGFGSPHRGLYSHGLRLCRSV